MNQITLSLIAALVTITSCQTDYSRESFGGLKLGVTAAKNKEAIYSSSKFTSYISSDNKAWPYYTFSTDAGKEFYGKVHSLMNKDSVILSHKVYITQFTELLPQMAEAIAANNANFILAKDGIANDKPTPEEIYNHLLRALSEKYPLKKKKIYEEGGYRIYTVVFVGRDVEISIGRVTSLGNSMGFMPSDAIELWYKLDSAFITKNHLDKYSKPSDDF